MGSDMGSDLATGAGSHEIAVYGTLRRGFPNHERAGMDELQFLGECRFSGTLYDLGPFPGVKLTDEGRVAGERYRCTDEALARLDRFEGATAPEPMFERVRVVLLEPPCEAWVYEYAGSVSAHLQVDSGDWLSYVRA